MDFQRQCLHLGRSNRRTVYWDQRDRSPTEITRPQAPPTFSNSVLPEVRPLFEEFADVFSDEVRQATTATTKHHMKLVKEKPFQLKPYSSSMEK